ncbi:MAG: hypothetical protein ACWA6X_04305 [Bauldia sp.]
MPLTLPRIASLKVVGPTTLDIRWKPVDGQASRSTVNLAGWIASGSSDLAPLADPERFATARLMEWGSAVTWAEGEDGDPGIDASHLLMIAEAQAPFPPRRPRPGRPN